MGIPYLLKKGELKFDQDISGKFIIKSPLDENEANEFLIIQEIITKEISQPISKMIKAGLIQKTEYQAKNLFYCLAKNENEECIGYGYGYLDNNSEDVFYLDTIGVHPEYRKNGIGTKIKVRMIKEAFKDPKINYVKAVTQADNFGTIKINEELGFKIKQNNQP